MPPAVVGIDQHVIVLDPTEPALEIRLSVDDLAHHQLSPPAREAAQYSSGC